MGAEAFENTSNLTDSKAAFDSVVKQAQYDYGHAGYTGTVAEKDGFKILTRTPLGPDDLKTKIEETLNENDKWGPAYALPIADDAGKLAGWVFYGCASS